MTDSTNDQEFAKQVDEHIERNLRVRLAKEGEHLEVRDVNDDFVGTVDHIDGDQLKLTKSASPDGQHHFVPLSAIRSMDDNAVYLDIAEGDVK